MELTETVDSINRQLREQYGFDNNTTNPIFRVVWSQDQFEKRLMDVTDEGLQLLTPQVRIVPKYRQWIVERWVLERLVVVPAINENELAGTKLSYEPIWIFETQLGAYLPPKYEVAKIVCDTLYAALGKSSLHKYVDSEAETTKEGRLQQIKDLELELFGNETPVGDALAHKTGVTVPHPKNIEV